ncbi:asparagine synthetase A [Thermococcus sp.]|uniref:asparagine synthetase A n=1 Tax=Thermococcus sp. TaxID=35749 RepID=UPI0025EDE79E|nr:asparagine synthetase A [Thermococcus sp.]
MDARTLRIKTEVLDYLSGTFLSRGYLWMLPKILSPITDPLWPDPAEQKIEPLEVEVRTYGIKLRLTHSMILHKQVAVSKFDRIFVLSPNVRIEAREPDGWHAFEFTQFDFEARGLKMEDVMKTLEDVVKGLTKRLCEGGLVSCDEYGDILKGSFPVYDYTKLEEEGIERLTTEEKRPFFVVNIPREFYDYYDEGKGRWHNYDLYVPGYGEVASGGEREWEYEKIMQKIMEGGLKPESFARYLKIVESGEIKPSAGAGLGVERLVTFFAGLNDIADAQVFPRIPYRNVEL